MVTHNTARAVVSFGSDIDADLLLGGPIGGEIYAILGVVTQCKK